MGKLTFEDIIRLVEAPYPDFELRPGKTALLLIDMQKFVLGEHYVKAAVRAGYSEEEAWEAVREYDERVKNVVKNVQKLLEVCRRKGFDIIHVRIQGPTNNPRHTAKVNRKIGLIIPPEFEDGDFIDEVKPLPGELVISKTNGGALSGTNLDFILRNMDIDSLIIVGFLTDQCVLATSIHAADLGYDVLLLEDACTTRSKQLHEAALLAQKDVCAKVKKTEEVLKILEKLPDKS
ncbi:MAG: isochorismatase family cysteine hydrolase [Nitrososphaeria archaeon]